MKNPRFSNGAVALAAIAWAALLVVLNLRGTFVGVPGRPPLPLLLSVLVPPALFLLAYATSARVRATALGLDLRLLTAIQGWRLVGAMFLVLMTFDLLPGTFAWPAGIGDMIVGAYAPFVVTAIMRQREGWRKHVLWLNLLGLLDFVGAIGGGVLSGRSPLAVFHTQVSTEIMQVLPLSLIPTFAVPFWIVLHIVSLLQLGQTARTQVLQPA